VVRRWSVADGWTPLRVLAGSLQRRLGAHRRLAVPRAAIHRRHVNPSVAYFGVVVALARAVRQADLNGSFFSAPRSRRKIEIQGVPLSDACKHRFERAKP